jgi:hypothetical protein
MNITFSMKAGQLPEDQRERIEGKARAAFRNAKLIMTPKEGVEVGEVAITCRIDGHVVTVSKEAV